MSDSMGDADLRLLFGKKANISFCEQNDKRAISLLLQVGSKPCLQVNV